MKILVTGATGFIGAAVARKLSALGHEITALSRSEAAAAKLRAAGLTPVPGDFTDPASLAAPAADVDAIVSTASIGQVEGSPAAFTRDRDAVAAMAASLGGSGKPLIFTSGSAIFGVFTKGEASPTIFDEDHPVPLPASVFAPAEAEVPAPFIAGFGGAMAPRAATELAVQNAAGIRGIAIRPGLVYGGGDGYDVLNLISLAKARGAAPHLGAGGVRQGYVHIDDLVELYILALDRAPAGAMLHAVTDEVALGDLAAAVSRLVGAGGKTEALSLMEMFARGGGGGVSLSVNKRLASDKTRRLLDWTPIRHDLLEDVEHGSYAGS
ncbi:MAG: NAD-dependent epimerase/dehydratase [Caulobacteraceae bacterium]|nr:NAD-dependent epimerase/dehydratase [Caulobacteraceae bacterium]